MTYPQQPAYAPQGYAPQQYQPQSQPSYPPAGYPMPPQQASAYVAQIPAPQGAQGLPATPPALGSVKASGGGAAAPKARHLLGRTIIIEPIRVDESAQDDKGKSRPEAYFHLTVCDGGPLAYGDSLDNDPAKQRPNTHRIETPCRFTNVSDYGYGFVNEVRDAIARGDLAAVGVFEQGTQGNRPYLLTKPGRTLDGKDRPDGDQRFALASDLWNRIFAKDLSWNSEPVSLVVPPSQPQQQVNYQPTAPAGYAQQQYAQTGTVPTPYGAAPAQQLHPEYVAAATQPAYGQAPNAYPPAGLMPQQGGYNPAAYQPQPTPAPQPSAFAAAMQQSAPPANPAFEAWLATLPPEQRAAYAPQQMQQPAYAPPPGPGI